MFCSTEDESEHHMDFSHMDGNLYVYEKEKKIPFFKFKTLNDRKEIQKDFSDFLKASKFKEDGDNQFILATVFLGMSNGRNHSFYVSDYKVLLPMIRKYTKDNKTIALVVSHFSEKTSSNGNEVEHIHILYKNGVKDRLPFIGSYLEECYDED
jgi:hypothetical protein